MEEFWLCHAGCKRVVEEEWAEGLLVNPITNVAANIIQCVQGFQRWRHSNHVNLFKELRSKLKELDERQSDSVVNANSRVLNS